MRQVVKYVYLCIQKIQVYEFLSYKQYKQCTEQKTGPALEQTRPSSTAPHSGDRGSLKAGRSRVTKGQRKIIVHTGGDHTFGDSAFLMF